MRTETGRLGDEAAASFRAYSPERILAIASHVEIMPTSTPVSGSTTGTKLRARKTISTAAITGASGATTGTVVSAQGPTR